MSLTLARDILDMYNVHMKNVTPSQARKNWFRLLDEAAEGEEIVIERNGHRLVLRREEAQAAAVPSYQGLIAAPLADRADSWGWEWSPEGLAAVEVSGGEGGS